MCKATRRANRERRHGVEVVWQDEVLEMIRARLAMYPCMHRKHEGGSTPPMSYDDWISCVVKCAREQGARHEREKAKGGA